MAFTTESLVRLKGQVEDTGKVSSALVLDAIEDSHTRIVARLMDSVDQQSPPDAVVLGETLLAVSAVLASLAAGQAAEGDRVVVGGQRVETGVHLSKLRREVAAYAEEAWLVLAPYLKPVGRQGMVTTATQPVLGE